METLISPTTPQDTGYAGFEYKAVRVPQQLASLYQDASRNFGWILERTSTRPPLRPLPLLPAIRSNTVTLNFKRDRGNKNRPMVDELQRKADASLASIARMERSKKSVGAAISAILGVVGAGLLAVSIFMGALGVLPTVLGAIGLVAWVGGAIVYFGINAARTAKLTPLIDKEQAALFATGEQAARLAR